MVSGNDAIRTEEKYKTGGYLSLSISLLDLPFFGGAE